MPSSPTPLAFRGEIVGSNSSMKITSWCGMLACSPLSSIALGGTMAAVVATAAAPTVRPGARAEKPLRGSCVRGSTLTATCSVPWLVALALPRFDAVDRHLVQCFPTVPTHLRVDFVGRDALEYAAPNCPV